MSSSFDDPDKFMMETRSASEVAERCIILCCVAAHSEDQSLFFEDWLKAEGLWRAVSPKERQFLLNPKPTRHEVIQASWRKEAFITLAWCMRIIMLLPPSVQLEDSSAILDLVPAPGESTVAFIRGAELRPFDEIDTAYADIYEAHWQIRDAQIHGKKILEGIDPGVIYERHYAMNWLRRYGIFEEQQWDDITTDT